MQKSYLGLGLVGIVSLSGCGSDPMRETPTQIDAHLVDGKRNETTAGGRYVECTLHYAEQHRNSTASAGGIADGAMEACKKIAAEYGIFHNEIAVYELLKVRNQKSAEETARDVASVPSAEQSAREFAAGQRNATVMYVVKSRPEH